MGSSCELSQPITRDERQEQCIQAWKKAGGKATVVGATGFGKTRIGLKIIFRLLNKKSDLKVLILVPTAALKKQWISEVEEFNIKGDVSVQVMKGAATRKYECDLLVIDEAHRINAATIANVFKVVKYKLILGLTATFERLDNRHVILEHFAPVCDTVPLKECLKNGWVAKYKDYVVLIDVDDMDIYEQYNTSFNASFAYFNYNYPLIMKLIGKNGFTNRWNLCKTMLPQGTQEQRSVLLKTITYHATNFTRMMNERKQFVYNHPMKLEVAKHIIQKRSDKKIITFSASIKMAEAFKNGYVFTSKASTKKRRMTLDEFAKQPEGSILHTSKLAEEGLNLPDISVGIMLGVNSSKTKQIQTLGRIIRAVPGKQAEFFTLVINDTIETEWMKRSKSDNNFEVIDVQNLYKILNNEPYELYTKPISEYTFRF